MPPSKLRTRQEIQITLLISGIAVAKGDGDYHNWGVPPQTGRWQIFRGAPSDLAAAHSHMSRLTSGRLVVPYLPVGPRLGGLAPSDSPQETLLPSVAVCTGTHGGLSIASRLATDHHSPQPLTTTATDHSHRTATAAPHHLTQAAAVWRQRRTTASKALQGFVRRSGGGSRLRQLVSKGKWKASGQQLGGSLAAVDYPHDHITTLITPHQPHTAQPLPPRPPQSLRPGLDPPHQLYQV